MKQIILSCALAILTSCATSKKTTYEIKYEEFKDITKDVCNTNPVEVTLAQHLYNEIKKYKKDGQKLPN
jgi:hypothetical protein